MFGKKPKPRALHIQILDALGVLLFDDLITRLVVPEAVILKLSVDFFGDPAPCHIHRGAVLSRIFLELSQTLETRSPHDVQSLPESMRSYLSGYIGAHVIRIYGGHV